MPKSKRKPRAKVSAVPPAAPVEFVAPVSESSTGHGGELSAEKACRSCSTSLPVQARFCSRCGEPQIDGLLRAAPLVPPEESTPSPAPAIIKPSLVTVPTTPKVAPVKPLGPLLVPALAPDRPIPLSLLQAGGAVPPPNCEQGHGAAKESGDESPGAEPLQSPVPAPAPVTSRMAEPESHPPAEPDPLFDNATETRILALRAGREITGERIDRVMAGFKLRPKPIAKPKPAKKADTKAEKKADKKAEKKPEKKAKGH